MNVSPGRSAGVAALVLAAVLTASCTTAGTPAAQQSTSTSGASGSAAPPATASAAPPVTASAAPPVTPTPESDEDQVRDTMQAYEDAYNTQNWDAYLQLLCTPMREQFTGPAMDMLKKTRADQGLTKINSTAVKIDGDNATATIDVENAVLGHKSIDIPMVREDGWKVCVKA